MLSKIHSYRLTLLQTAFSAILPTGCRYCLGEEERHSDLFQLTKVDIILKQKQRLIIWKKEEINNLHSKSYLFLFLFFIYFRLTTVHMSHELIAIKYRSCFQIRYQVKRLEALCGGLRHLRSRVPMRPISLWSDPAGIWTCNRATRGGHPITARLLNILV